MSPSDSKKVEAEVREEQDAGLLVWMTEQGEAGDKEWMPAREAGKGEAFSPRASKWEVALGTCSRCFTSRTVRE